MTSWLDGSHFCKHHHQHLCHQHRLLYVILNRDWLESAAVSISLHSSHSLAVTWPGAALTIWQALFPCQRNPTVKKKERSLSSISKWLKETMFWRAHVIQWPPCDWADERNLLLGRKSRGRDPGYADSNTARDWQRAIERERPFWHLNDHHGICIWSSSSTSLR